MVLNFKSNKNDNLNDIKDVIEQRIHETLIFRSPTKANSTLALKSKFKLIKSKGVKNEKI